MKASSYNHMGSGLRFFTPDLSTHGDEAPASYILTAAGAVIIHQWLVPNGMGRLLLGFAVSLSGVILFELLRLPNLLFDRLFIEGVSFHSGGPAARVDGIILSRMMVAKHWKVVCDSEVGVRKPQRPYDEEAARSMVANFTVMSEDNIRAAVHDCSHVSLLPFSPAIQRRCIFMYGEEGSDLWLTHRMVPRPYPEAELHVWPGWGHYERMDRDSVTYGAMLQDITLGSASTDRP